MIKAPHIEGLDSEFHAAKVERGDKKRILLVMHGLGDSLNGYRFLPELLKIDGLSYLLVNAPDAYFTGYSWYDIFGDITPGILRSREALFWVLEQLEQEGWPPEHVGVFGFSQGCLMALDIACRYPKQLGAIVGVSGYVGFLEQYPERLSPAARKQKLLVTHGNADPMLPLEVSKKQVHALKGMGLQIDWREYTKEHTIDPRQELGDIRRFLEKNLFL
jgi:phospholipase/carboxylesterase